MKRLVKTVAPASSTRNVALLSPSSAGASTVYLQPWQRLRGIAAHDRESTVAAITSAIAADLSNAEDLPVVAHALGTNDDVTDKSHYCYALNVAPSMAMNAATFRQHFANAINFTGECYIVEMNRTLTPLVGGTVEIAPAAPGTMFPDGSPALVSGYVIRDEAGRIRGMYDGLGRAAGSGAPAGSLLHRAYIPHPENPLRANPPVASALLPSEVLHLQRQATRTILQNDGMPAAVLSIKPPVEGATLTQEELDEATRRINLKLSESKRKVVVFNSEMDLKPFASSSPLDAGWAAVADQARAEILSVWRAPSSVLGISAGVTFENQRISLRHYYAAVLLPMLNLLTATLNQHARRAGYRLVIDTSNVAALNESLDDLAARAVTLVQAGVASVNEARELMGLSPVDGGDLLAGGGAPAAAPADPLADSERDAVPLEVRSGIDPDRFSAALDAVADVSAAVLYAYASQFHERVARMLVGALRRRAGVSERVSGSEVPAPNFDVAEALNVAARSEELLNDLTPMFGTEAARLGAVAAGALDVPAGATTLTAWESSAGARVARLVAGDGARAGWVQSLADDVQEAINVAFQAGESVDGAAARIRDVLSASGENGADVRAERIARTEMSGLMNDVTYETMRQSDVVTGKRWYSVADNRTRDSHAALNGVEVPFNEKFNVGGFMADGPHDVTLPAVEVINCRCRLIPVV